MIDENNLLKYIENSPFLDNETRSLLITQFHRLHADQITELIEYFNHQKEKITQLLEKLNNTGTCNFEEIQGAIHHVQMNTLHLILNEESKGRELEISQLKSLSPLWNE